ncbi:cytochrome C oxidase Cbb3 [Flavobacterium branchiophilum]|uniref:FixH protein n=1 Tax=Flavobacterium branchiophilum TaxID=55197 RepID=A0A543FZQ1_9FLAO|nr:FixH family protein [Flavobacterium branchiophilum]OXA74141.1 cytochrome C oxidase Cbb3 [Flavobacterium branchiophilum] [Flavobacterium branchiophilum NBRC 15030 = ATCC 35035]TQM39311.1 FixH protein [Flavobacterium branchiophilum]GEM54963.1 cytochrome Cbb3 oxidase maturation protein CcoH [Flavobacterium branchiophilum NBRC 15030 = ATCC 35035]
MNQSDNQQNSLFKISWGTGIFLAFVGFMSFILYFVIKVQSNAKYDNELVVAEYYKHDAHFQDEMQKEQNAFDSNSKPQIMDNAQTIDILFPNTIDISSLKGTISFYRPSNQKLDFKVPISGQKMEIQKQNLVAGRWNISIEWNYKNKSYLLKENLYIR